MKTRKGIPCNETQFTKGSLRDRISFRFVSDDGTTPSGCTVRLGDIDPVTGEPIIDMDLFREYYSIVDHEIHKNLDAIQVHRTEDYKDWQKMEKERYKAAFEKEHGYPPSKDDIRFHMEEIESQRWHLSLDSLTDDEDEASTLERKSEYAYTDPDPFGADLPEDLYALKEYSESLTGIRKAVYEAMLDNLAGSKRQITNVELAKRLGISEGRVRQYQKSIMDQIRKKIRGE